MSDEKTDKAADKQAQQSTQQQAQAGAQAQVVTESTSAAAAEPPDTGRPVPPDAALGQSIHQPGRAPGMNILDGPAEMTVGAHRKGKK